MESIGTGLAGLETDGHRADIYLTRPEKRNAMTIELMRDAIAAFERVDADEEIRAIALLGEGPVFCAGMDLEMMRDRAEPDVDIEWEQFPKLLETIESVRQPVVAGIKRAAPAGAFELTLPCDLRVLGSDAAYGVIEVKLGTFPHGGGTQRLARLVGLSKAKEIVLTGEFIPPEEALNCGLVHEICEPEAVDERARALADELCSNAPLGIERAKRLLNVAFDVPLEQGLALEDSLARELDDTRDYREGIEARIERRDPKFERR